MKKKRLTKWVKNLQTRLKQTSKALKTFITNNKKNYQNMKKKLKKIWLPIMAVIFATTMTSCNVTRKVTTQSEYLQRGDTAIVIMTKTIESYDATKKGM